MIKLNLIIIKIINKLINKIIKILVKLDWPYLWNSGLLYCGAKLQTYPKSLVGTCTQDIF